MSQNGMNIRQMSKKFICFGFVVKGEGIVLFFWVLGSGSLSLTTVLGVLVLVLSNANRSRVGFN